MNFQNTGPIPFRKHKDSGVHWLGSVPEHWDVAPGKAVFSVKKDPNRGMKERTVLSLSYGRIRVRQEEELHGLVPESFETYQVVEPGDIICRPTDLQNDWNSLRFGISNDKGIITSAYFCLRTLPGVDRRYGHLLLHTYDLKKVFYGLGSGLRQNLDWDDFKYLPCTLPPLDEQVAIVRYLDDAEHRIKAFMSAKERLIALLEEERQAVIHQAVTRGLDPNVRLKPSGVEWLGDVPEHWKTIQLGRIGSFSKGSGGTKDDEVSMGIPCVRYGDIYTTHKYFVDQTRSFISEEKLDQYTPIKRGDVLFPASGETIEEIGKSAVNLIEPPMYCGSDLIIFRPTTPIDPKFSGYLLDSAIAQDQKSRMGRGVSIMHIYSNQLKYLWLGLPPKDEQEAIAQHLGEVTNDIATALESTRRQIELMEEYRTRLIADVVTGKVCVTGSVPVTGDTLSLCGSSTQRV